MKIFGYSSRKLDISDLNQQQQLEEKYQFNQDNINTTFSMLIVLQILLAFILFIFAIINLVNEQSAINIFSLIFYLYEITSSVIIRMFWKIRKERGREIHNIRAFYLQIINTYFLPQIAIQIYQRGQYYFVANGVQTHEALIKTTLILLFISFFVSLSLSYTIYTFNYSLNALQLHIYIASYLSLIICVVLLVKYFLSYGSFLIIATFLLLTFLISSNYFWWEKGFSIIGTLLLIIIIVLISCNGNIYRNAKQIENEFSQDCRNQMQLIHQDYLFKLGCPYKYSHTNQQQPFPNCERDQQQIQWEQDEGKTNLEKLNQIKCLNFNCCGIASQYFTYELYQQGNLQLFLVMNMLFLVILCYNINQNNFDEQEDIFTKSFERKVIYFIALFLFILFLVILLTFSNPSFLKQLITQDDLQKPNQNSPKFRLYTESDIQKLNECQQEFNFYYKKYYIDSFENINYPQKSEINVSILATQLDIKVLPSFNDPSVKVYDNSFAELFLQKKLEPNQQFLAAKGKVENIIEFFMYNVCLNALDIQKTSKKIKNIYLLYQKIYKQKDSLIVQINNVEQKILKKNKLMKIQQFDDKDKQNQKLNFQSLKIRVFDMHTNSLITNQQIKIQLYQDFQQCLEQEISPYVQQKGLQDSHFTLNNLFVSSYTVFITTKGYNVQCEQISLKSQEVITLEIYLSRILKEQQIRILLQWKNTLSKINLFSNINNGPNQDCITGFLNDQCPQANVEFQSYQNKIESIVINQLYSNNQILFVKQTINQKEFQQIYNAGQTNFNEILIQSGAKVSIYVKDIKFPVYQGFIPDSNDQNVIQEENLAWIIGCFNGGYGNKFQEINEYWTQHNETFDILKQENQEFPQAEICEKIYEKKNNL